MALAREAVASYGHTRGSIAGTGLEPDRQITVNWRASDASPEVR